MFVATSAWSKPWSTDLALTSVAPSDRRVGVNDAFTRVGARLGDRAIVPLGLSSVERADATVLGNEHVISRLGSSNVVEVLWKIALPNGCSESAPRDGRDAFEVVVRLNPEL